MKKLNSKILLSSLILASTIGLTNCGDSEDVHYRSYNQTNPSSDNVEAKQKQGTSPSAPVIAPEEEVATEEGMKDAEETEVAQDSQTPPSDPAAPADPHMEDLSLINQMTLGETKGNEAWTLTSSKVLVLK